MPEDPKEFTPSGADGAGQIGKQEWELPHSVSAPPDGFSPNVETASYDGYGEEHTTDYHPPVEQGEFLHPFKVNRFRDEDDELQIRVRVGRFYYTPQVITVKRITPHGPHGQAGITDEVGGHQHTPSVAATSGPVDTEGGSPNYSWPVTIRPDAESVGPESWWTVDIDSGSEGYTTSVSPYTPLVFRSGLTFQNTEEYSYFSAFDEPSSVWLRYIIDSSMGAGAFGLAGDMGAIQVVYVKDSTLVGAGAAAVPTNHGKIQPLSSQLVSGGGTTVKSLLRANPTWASNPSDFSLTNTYTFGTYYIKIASIAATGDDTIPVVDQLIYDNVFLNQTWVAVDTTGVGNPAKSGFGLA